MLKSIIEQHAPKPQGKPWRYVGSDMSSKTKSVGSWWGSDSKALVYGYRNYVTRLLLILATFFPCMYPLALVVRHLALGDAIVLGRIEWIGFIVGGVFLAYVWWRYFAARVVLDDQSITEFAPFKVHRLRWQEVTEWRIQKGDVFGTTIIVQGLNKKRVKASVFISEFEELQEEITRRTGSPSTQRQSDS